MILEKFAKPVEIATERFTLRPVRNPTPVSSRFTLGISG